MFDSMRLRQICLAAPRLEPVVDDLAFVFGLSVCHRDPNLAAYGLKNALLPLGTNFIEVVAPLFEGTAAGRFIARTRGHGGYMAIFQTSMPRERQAHAAALGVRTAHEIEREDYQSAQLHPRDCRAAFIEFGHSRCGEERMGSWWPAGPKWQEHVRTQHTVRLASVVLESPDPADLAALWSRVLAAPLQPLRTLARDAVNELEPESESELGLEFDGVQLAFTKAATECLGTLVLEVRDAQSTLARAVDRGHRIAGGGFHLGGMQFEVRQAAPGNSALA